MEQGGQSQRGSPHFPIRLLEHPPEDLDSGRRTELVRPTHTASELEEGCHDPPVEANAPDHVQSNPRIGVAHVRRPPTDMDPTPHIGPCGSVSEGDEGKQEVGVTLGVIGAAGKEVMA